VFKISRDAKALRRLDEEQLYARRISITLTTQMEGKETIRVEERTIHSTEEGTKNQPVATSGHIS
jgi:hypothetical protein